MGKSEMEELVKAIAVTAELTGTELSIDAARVMAMDLSEYPINQVLAALTKCRRSLSGRLTVQAVISRIDDGRPGPEEAWAMVPRDESASIVWTDEMAQAFGIANSLICDGSTIQARMAFIESYKRLCDESREQKIPVRWTPSLGHDKRGRESVLMDAVMKGRLAANHALGLLPHIDGSDAKENLLAIIRSTDRLIKIKAIDQSPKLTEKEFA
ncbi:hypothetical protein [Nitrosomonas sp. Nm58]|uniref:hypothetical protein n=1 Tax=Nitrosomonas sp. Nm58 TaxID=200126 RepID=UPI000894D936|nr:hypothetical protein [Nitrosomonas sp. Nm58]SDY38091.1 hypothetical protein SAMN05421754_100830 [Nitrosomonas sp. Nm58]